VRLFEHPEFEQAIIKAAEHFRERGLRPALIEEDYYVTEVLRIIATSAGDKVIFKSGTSLSKRRTSSERGIGHSKSLVMRFWSTVIGMVPSSV
jgi:hypothetical protein